MIGCLPYIPRLGIVCAWTRDHAPSYACALPGNRTHDLLARRQHYNQLNHTSQGKFFFKIFLQVIFSLISPCLQLFLNFFFEDISFYLENPFYLFTQLFLLLLKCICKQTNLRSESRHKEMGMYSAQICER